MTYIVEVIQEGSSVEEFRTLDWQEALKAFLGFRAEYAKAQIVIGNTEKLHLVEDGLSDTQREDLKKLLEEA